MRWPDATVKSQECEDPVVKLFAGEAAGLIRWHRDFEQMPIVLMSQESRRVTTSPIGPMPVFARWPWTIERGFPKTTVFGRTPD
jgi:hypothetical protein